jgi:hypothetical protein
VESDSYRNCWRRFHTSIPAQRITDVSIPDQSDSNCSSLFPIEPVLNERHQEDKKFPQSPSTQVVHNPELASAQGISLPIQLRNVFAARNRNYILSTRFRAMLILSVSVSNQPTSPEVTTHLETRDSGAFRNCRVFR